MQSVNLSKTSPINISIFNKILTDEIFEDIRFMQLLSLLINTENICRYTYCFYCDSSSIKTNLFVPVFHTIYLASQTNNVLIKDHNDIWLKDIFKHNKYYILSSSEDDFDYAAHGIEKIEDIRHIGGVL